MDGIKVLRWQTLRSQKAQDEQLKFAHGFRGLRPLSLGLRQHSGSSGAHARGPSHPEGREADRLAGRRGGAPIFLSKAHSQDPASSY